MSPFNGGIVARANTCSGLRVFDWDKAARLILRSEVPFAEAMLHEDPAWTHCTILVNFKPTSPYDTYTFLASTYATPVLILAGSDPVECWIPEDQVPASWYSTHHRTDLAKVHWPDTALAILSRGM